MRPLLSARRLLVLLASTAAVALAAADVGAVSGKVVDNAGRGNEGVKVTIVSGDKELATAYTDSDGKFTLEKVPVGKGYAVLAVRKLRGLSMSGKKESLAVKAGQTTDAGEVQIQVGGG